MFSMVETSSASKSPKDASNTSPTPPVVRSSIRTQIQSLWKRSGLKSRQLKTMFKGAWPPTIALALYQYEPFEAAFPTLGYLVAIASILSMSILPRAKFIQSMIFSILATGVGCCVALLTCYSSVQARLHTSTPITQQSIGASGARQAIEYNSSASAVSAVFLFFNIMFANALRFSRPQLQIPIILYSIFANVSGTFAPTFASMDSVYLFIRQLATAFLSGFAIATICHLLIFPFSARDVVTAEVKGYFGLLRKVLLAEREYLESMETADMLREAVYADKKEPSRFSKASGNLKGSMAALSALHAKLQADIPFAKREIVWSHLGPKDISTLFANLRKVYLPLMGLVSVIDIFERLVIQRDWMTAELESQSGHQAQEEIQEWNEIMQALHEPFTHAVDGILQGLEHVTYCLKFEKSPRPENRDIEGDPNRVLPGTPDFGKHLDQVCVKFWDRRAEALSVWCKQKGIPFLHNDIPENSEHFETRLVRIFSRDHARQQLYMILYMEYLLHAAAKAVIDLVQQGDSLVESGAMNRKRFIIPGKRRLWKWLQSAFKVEDSSNEDAVDSFEETIYTLSLGDAFKERKNPEHLAPASSFQRFGQMILRTVAILRSNEVAFGFRVACATMSIAIIAFLQDTQYFFIEQRLVWAMIMVAISMTMTSGSGVFGFIARVVGTFMAMCSSLAIWYIAGGRGVPVGVLILLWCAIFFILYFLLNYPRFTPVCMITMVTHCLILGYELQVDEAGVTTQTSSGQVYYPIYLLGPYRLATVAAGCTVAFFWTYFPYPLTAGNTLRRQLGETLYLLANYYSVVHYSIRTRLNSSGGDPHDKKSPNALLDRTRTKLLGKLLALNTELQGHLSFIPLEFTFGGKFPLDEYKGLVKSVNSLRNYISLLSFSTRDYLHDPQGVNVQWLEDLNKITAQVAPTSHEITKLLIMLSSSLLDGKPLPPYLSPPPAFRMAHILSEMDPEILSAKHFLEPGYASFAVTQVAGKLVNDDLTNVLRHVKNLVGEVDFSFHIESTASSSESTLYDTEKKDKAD